MSDLFRVRVIGMTKPMVLDLPDPESLMVYQARVSNPTNQKKMTTGEKVISNEKFVASCKARGEWSIFQMVNINLEIIGPRDITRQFTRHESMLVVEHDDGELTFQPDGIDKHAGGVQEFSQRYARAPGFVKRQCRMDDPTDKQSSIVDDEFDADHRGYNEQIADYVSKIYEARLDEGEAKETARVILPEGLTLSHLYVNATVRSWLHYLEAREKHATQKEHRDLAYAIRNALHGVMPLLF